MARCPAAKARDRHRVDSMSPAVDPSRGLASEIVLVSRSLRLAIRLDHEADRFDDIPQCGRVQFADSTAGDFQQVDRNARDRFALRDAIGSEPELARTKSDAV